MLNLPLFWFGPFLLAGGVLAAWCWRLRRRLASAELALERQTSLDELRIAEIEHLALLGNWRYDFERRRVGCSVETRHLFGLPTQTADPGFLTFLRRVHPEDRRALLRCAAAAVRLGQGFDLTLRVHQPGQATRWLHLVALPMVRGNAEVALVRGTVMDISARKLAEDALRDSEERLSGIVNSAHEAIIGLDENMRVVLFNRSAQLMFGYSEEQVMGDSIERFLPDSLREAHSQHMRRFVQGGFSSASMGVLTQGTAVRADGETFPIEASASRILHSGRPMYSVILHDITVRRRNEDRLRFLASYDQLTSLPNRMLFHQRLERALAHAQRFNKGLAVLFIDLDRFKIINDTLGHHAGDEILREVARRLMTCLRETDIVARLGGDEFGALIEQVSDMRQTASITEKLLRSIGEPFMLDGHEHHLGASIGISTYPGDGQDVATLLKNADIAMYRAKEQGRNNAQYYAPALNFHSVERLSLESGMRRGLLGGEFLLHYQPQMDIASGRITGMEALVRWKRPQTGMVSPLQFIPIAEETGLIVQLGEWVLREACEFNQSLRKAGLPQVRVAVNLSPRQFNQASLVTDVARVLDNCGLHPDALGLEITESMVMGNPEQAIQTLRRLKSMGISLSIDDFGTGYSSLGYLKRFPIDYIKIDRTFVKDIPENPDDGTITRTIIAMAHSLRLRAIAEGVESQEQLDFLRGHGCDELQGYLFSRPLDADAMRTILQRQADGDDALALAQQVVAM